MEASRNKSTTSEIKERFDNEVERFSNLETGQSATIDAPLVMELLADAAFSSTPQIKRVLDIGCGAGNNTLKLLEKVADADCDLLDLSPNMLARASERVTKATSGNVRTFEGDFRETELEKNSYDVILAAAVLHHLRGDSDWENAFAKIHSLLKPGGGIWISDLVSHEIPAVHAMMWKRYGEYLTRLGGEDYRDKVFAYIEKEDTPRPLTHQLDLLKQVGFAKVEVLHKNSCFAAFGAVK